jgi:hypothetical protein
MKNGGKLQPATVIPKTQAEIEEMASAMNMPIEMVRDTLKDTAENDLLYLNDVYQVAVRANAGVTHLSIKRLDKEPVHDWRDLQDIKNELCGKESNAVEVYPAESRLVDSANQYHLWVANNEKVNEVLGMIGFQQRFVTSKQGGGTKQRPRHE